MRESSGHSHGEAVRELIGRVALIELAVPVLGRALEPFPVPVRTLDALHLASIEFLRGAGKQLNWQAMTIDCWRRRKRWVFRFANCNSVVLRQDRVSEVREIAVTRTSLPIILLGRPR